MRIQFICKVNEMQKIFIKKPVCVNFLFIIINYGLYSYTEKHISVNCFRSWKPLQTVDK